jgi:hypothetical protein
MESDMVFTPREVGIEDPGGPDMVFTESEVARLNAENQGGAQQAQAVEANNASAASNAELEAFQADPAGHTNRIISRAILQQQFEVIDPETHQGERAGNQVTQEEFDRLVRQHSDIQLGRTDLQVDPEGLEGEERDNYRGAAMNDLTRIMQTESGRELVNGLADNQDERGRHRVTRIGGNHDGHYHGEQADAADDPHYRSLHPEDAYDHDGSDTNVYYHPGRTENVRSDPTEDGMPWETIRSDVALYHELTHAHHATHGTLAEGTVTEQSLREDGVDFSINGWQEPMNDLNPHLPVEQAEHQAVGLGRYANNSLSENVYRRQRAQIGRLGTRGAVAGDEDMTVRPSYHP